MRKKIPSKVKSGDGVQRKENRYAVKTGASVLFKKSSALGLFKNRVVYSGTIVDISHTGIRAEYTTATVWSGDFNKMSIVTTDNHISINDIPCKIISDRKVKSLQNGTFLRRCGIEFGKLSDYHKLQLSYFIKKYTVVSDNQKSWHIEFA
jgi:c-di-GMP-binding flagellar brake protein YcgR